jgi:ATP dependent DNA ligase domain
VVRCPAAGREPGPAPPGMLSRCSRASERHHLVGVRLDLGAVRGPGVHQLAPFVEQVAAPVRCLHRVRDDVRQRHLQVRKATLASIVAKARPGIRFNEHIEGDRPDRLRPCLQDGLEGIVSKRKGSPYRSGRSPDWLKMKNPEASAVKREAEEDWGRGG